MLTLATLEQILDCGPIVAVNVDLRLIVTRNGVYYNVFNEKGDCIDVRAVSKDMWNITAAKFWDEGKKFAEEYNGE